MCSPVLWHFRMFHPKISRKNHTSACKHSIKLTLFFIPPHIWCEKFNVWYSANKQLKAMKKAALCDGGNGERTRTPLIYSEQSVIQWHRHVLIMCAVFLHACFLAASPLVCSSCWTNLTFPTLRLLHHRRLLSLCEKSLQMTLP